MDSGQKRQIWSPNDLAEISGITRHRFLPKGSAIYFLISNGEVVYIGKTIDLDGRLLSHRNNRVNFDEIYYFRVGGHDQRWLTSLESGLIKKIRPAYNLTCKKSPLSERESAMLEKYLPAGARGTFGWEIEA